MLKRDFSHLLPPKSCSIASTNSFSTKGKFLRFQFRELCLNSRRNTTLAKLTGIINCHCFLHPFSDCRMMASEARNLDSAISLQLLWVSTSSYDIIWADILCFRYHTKLQGSIEFHFLPVKKHKHAFNPILKEDRVLSIQCKCLFILL